MLNPELTPTQLVSAEERTTIRIGPLRKPTPFWVLRFLRIGFRWSMRIARAFVVRRLSATDKARLVGGLLEELGGLWIKAGQLLSLRTDLFSREFCHGLTRLQSHADGFSPAVARQIIEEDLGAPIDSVFDRFDDQPFATASIGQIHRAHLRREGVWVAVKVQRPYLKDKLGHDLRLIGFVVWMLCRFKSLGYMRWEDALWELTQIMEEELDYWHEASAMRRMRKRLRKHNIYVPRLFRTYSSSRVLTSEFIHASLMSDFITLYSKDPARLAKWLQENNIDPRKVARRLLKSIFRQIFEDNLYHGDLHPGNILLLKNSQVAFIDMGSIGFTEIEWLGRFRIMTHAMGRRDFSKAADMALLLVSNLANAELGDFKPNIVRALRRWATRTQIAELPYHEKSLEAANIAVSRLMIEHRLPTEWAFLRISRVFSTLDSALVYLYPDINYTRLIRDYFADAEQRSLKTAYRQAGPTFVNTLRGLVDLQEGAKEYLFHMSAIVRRQAQVLERQTSKAGLFFQAVFGVLVAALAAGGVGAVLTFLHQHYHPWVQRWMGARIERITAAVPPLEYSLWIVIIALDVYFVRSCIKLRNKFSEKEDRTKS